MISYGTLQGTMACSDYTDTNQHLIIITSSVWTPVVYKVVSYLGLVLLECQEDYSEHTDTRRAGRWHAWHAETKLLAFYLLHSLKVKYAMKHSGPRYISIVRHLRITVRRDNCFFGREFARRLYEAHGIQVILSYNKLIAYPRCKHYYCTKLAYREPNGQFCDSYENKVEFGCMILVKQPPMELTDLPGLLCNMAPERISEASLLREAIWKTSATPKQGFHLIIEGRGVKETLIVLLHRARREDRDDHRQGHCPGSPDAATMTTPFSTIRCRTPYSSLSIHSVLNCRGNRLRLWMSSMARNV
jgi:hypothetical protein